MTRADSYHQSHQYALSCSSRPSTKVGSNAVNLPTVVELLECAIGEHRLLDHPFYRRWESGELKPGELAGYASQYRHFEEHLPVALAAVAEMLPVGHARDLVLANLSDEIDGPVSHLELFDGFAASVGASQAPAGRAITALIETYDRAISAGVAGGLSAIAAYEVQAGDVAITKSRGLRDHYGVDAPGRSFWDVHAEREDDHARWTAEALSESDDRDAISLAARQSADAWWSFLDEREEFARSL